ncbi:Choline/ethanolaminephosphotransferase [Lichtheimia hyalospora FSU 10163]|nr:Choline/ethanolaminephosphotransferase [Lichtheimia hyalospora FSU 10163]
MDKDLAPDKLANLKHYKYNSIDRSFFSRYLLRHYWDWAHQWFPSSMAPNLITVTGFLFIIVNVVLASCITPSLEHGAEGMHRWVYLCYAAGIWLYSTFDNVDGRQARKTKTSSPLGELFDHGCDALNIMFSAILQASAIGSGHSQATLLLCITEALGFYLSTQEQYHTGILYLGYVNAPTEGILLAVFVFTLSGIYGSSVWMVSVGQIIPFMPSAVAHMSFSHGWIAFISIFSLLVHCPLSLYTIRKANLDDGKPFASTVIQQDIPIIIYCVAIYAWCTSPYSFILSHQYFIPFALAIGIVFGHMASKIILAHLTKSTFPKPTILLVPLVGGAIVANFPRVFGFTPQSELLYVWSFLMISASMYLYWTVTVIHALCSYLDIHCFTIQEKHPSKSQ